MLDVVMLLVKLVATQLSSFFIYLLLLSILIGLKLQSD